MKSYFQFKGAKIRYSLKGKGNAIVFVHGFLGCIDLWKDQITDLSRNFKTIALDLPGHGESESLGYLHSMEMQADLIMALLKQLKIRKVILVGHSMGGYVGLAFAEKYTDRLKALILVNTTAARDSKSRLKSRKQLIELLPKKRKQLLKSLVDSFFVIPTFKRRYLVKRYLQWANQCEVKGIAAAVRGMMERKEREIILKFAPYPYLIVAGKEDPIIPLKQSNAEANLNENSKLIVLEGTGHITPLERSFKLNSEIMKFLRENKLS